MKPKIIISVALIVAGVFGAYYAGEFSGARQTEEALAVADGFITALYETPGDAAAAHEFVSAGYAAIETTGMTTKLLETAQAVVGNYVNHSAGTDVTDDVAPGEGRGLKIVKFDVIYSKDNEGRMLVTMLYDGDQWRVHGFNINSPLLTEAQTTADLGR
ncbi:MAG: hypothetical protein Q8R76_04575 [Candidatus Omnitrophota bacterium]|nr:hypothetical protein [Candidatus Omnitrophota bacterium]